MATDRTYTIINAEEQAELHPGRFQIPELEQRRRLGPDFLAKLIFELVSPGVSGRTGERMWVAIEQRNVAGDGSVIYRGRLRNHPVFLGGALDDRGHPLAYDAVIFFEPKHIADYTIADQELKPEPPRRAAENTHEVWQCTACNRISYGPGDPAAPRCQYLDCGKPTRLVNPREQCAPGVCGHVA